MHNFMNVYGYAIMNSKNCIIIFHIFRDKNKFNMRIFLFTSEDLPYFKDQNARASALKYARQLKDADV